MNDKLAPVLNLDDYRNGKRPVPTIRPTKEYVYVPMYVAVPYPVALPCPACAAGWPVVPMRFLPA